MINQRLNDEPNRKIFVHTHANQRDEAILKDIFETNRIYDTDLNNAAFSMQINFQAVNI